MTAMGSLLKFGAFRPKKDLRRGTAGGLGDDRTTY